MRLRWLADIRTLLAGDDPDRVAKSYGGNTERLVKAKRRYDPDKVSSSILLPVRAASAGAHHSLLEASR